MSLRASAAEGRTLLISFRRAVDANVRAKSIDCCTTSAKLFYHWAGASHLPLSCFGYMLWLHGNKGLWKTSGRKDDLEAVN